MTKNHKGRHSEIPQINIMILEIRKLSKSSKEQHYMIIADSITGIIITHLLTALIFLPKKRTVMVNFSTFSTEVPYCSCSAYILHCHSIGIRQNKFHSRKNNDICIQSAPQTVK